MSTTSIITDVASGQDINQAALSQPLSGNLAAPSAVCPVCLSAVGRNAYTVVCSSCTKAVHLNCIAQKYKEACGTPAKNNLEWLHGFIQHAGLRYTCQCCGMTNSGNPLAASNAGNSQDPAFAVCSSYNAPLLRDMRNDISAIGKQVDDLQSLLLSQIHRFAGESAVLVSDSGKCDGVVTQDSNAASITKGQQTYVQALTKNITDAVKQLVSEGILSQKKADTDSRSIIIYGKSEKGYDDAFCNKLLEYFECEGGIDRIHRLGRKTYDSSGQPIQSKRPIKITLQLASDCKFILSNAWSLKRESQFAGISIAQFLTREQLDRIKVLRIRCDELNKNHPIDTKGRKVFVVISGKLMKRGADGKMQQFKDSITPMVNASLGNHAPSAANQSLSSDVPTVSKNT